jgi:hypothetical protein
MKACCLTRTARLSTPSSGQQGFMAELLSPGSPLEEDQFVWNATGYPDTPAHPGTCCSRNSAPKITWPVDPTTIILRLGQRLWMEHTRAVLARGDNTRTVNDSIQRDFIKRETPAAGMGLATAIWIEEGGGETSGTFWTQWVKHLATTEVAVGNCTNLSSTCKRRPSPTVHAARSPPAYEASPPVPIPS